MSYLFTSESASVGNLNKVDNQISVELTDNFLAFNFNPKVACKTLINTRQVEIEELDKYLTHYIGFKVQRPRQFEYKLC